MKRLSVREIPGCILYQKKINPPVMFICQEQQWCSRVNLTGACLFIQKMSKTKKILPSNSLLTPLLTILSIFSAMVFLCLTVAKKERNSLTFLTPFDLHFDCWVKLTRTVSMCYKHAGDGCKYVRWTNFTLYVDYTN